MTTLSIVVSILFLATAIVTVLLFIKAAGFSGKVLLIITGWAIIQSLLASLGFYKDTSSMPPRFIVLIGPAIIFIILLFLSGKGRLFIDSLQLRVLTLMHVVRIPVEIVLYYLCVQKLIPSNMTFEGYNMDILSGISAIVIYYFCFIKGKWSRRILLVWNLICLILLINIVVIAVLSAQTPFQQLAFEQPNVVIISFPYVLLPAVIVPLVLLSHLVAIRQLIKSPALTMIN